MFDKLLAACAAFAGATLAAIVAGISVNVVLRNFFGAPIYGLLDLVEYGLLVVTFLGAPWVLSKNAHVVVDLVTGALPDGPRATLARVMAGVGFVVSCILVFYAWEAMTASQARGSMIRKSFVFPEWWVLAVMPFSGTLIALEFARQVFVPPARRKGDEAGL